MFGESLCWQCTVLALTQGCRGHQAAPRDIPQLRSVPEPICLSSKKQILSLKHLNTPCTIPLASDWGRSGSHHCEALEFD